MPTSSCTATLDDASRARLGLDLGPAVSGAIPIKVTGKIGTDSRVGIDADLTALKLDNILPGWVKVPGKSTHATFNVVQKPNSTRFEDIVIEGGGGVSIKGALEVDQNGELHQRQLPDLFAVRRRQGLAEGRPWRRRRDESHHARRRVRRPRLPQIGDVEQGSRLQEQDQEYGFRPRPETRRGGRL